MNKVRIITGYQAAGGHLFANYKYIDWQTIPDNGLQYWTFCIGGCKNDEFPLPGGAAYLPVCPMCGEDVYLISEL